jgi:hypothetical protein
MAPDLPAAEAIRSLALHSQQEPWRRAAVDSKGGSVPRCARGRLLRHFGVSFFKAVWNCCDVLQAVIIATQASRTSIARTVVHLRVNQGYAL